MRDVVILMATCDNRHRIWGGFEYSFSKYWPNREWPIYALTNEAEVPFVDRSIKTGFLKRTWSGRGRDWSNRLIIALEAIEAQVILLICDDHWLYERVDNDRIKKYANLVLDGCANYIRLCVPRNRRTKVRKGKEFYLCESLGYVPDVHRTSTLAALWRKSVLCDLLFPNESAWDFESTRGVERSKAYSSFLGVYEDVLSFNTGRIVVKRKWTKDAVEYAKKENLCIDFSLSATDFSVKTVGES